MQVINIFIGNIHFDFVTLNMLKLTLKSTVYGGDHQHIFCHYMYIGDQSRINVCYHLAISIFVIDVYWSSESWLVYHVD